MWVDELIEDFPKRVLVNVVARGIVLAEDEDTTIEALHARAAHAEAALPHDLGVVSTHLALGALVGSRVVELVLSNPRLDRLGGRPVVPTAPEYVLPVGPIGVDHLTVKDPLGGPSPGVAGQVPVPREEWQVVQLAGLVVGIHELT